jgi:uncharacterized protein DUF1553/uncharacterized protein DUF1549/cytochrome c
VRSILATLLVLAAAAIPARGARQVAASAAGRLDAARAFAEVVAPTLANECLRCHGADRSRSGLRVDSRASLLAGGERGPELVPGDPDASRLVRALRHDDPDVAMPPKKTLPAGVAAAFEEWVRGGAPWPEGFELSKPAAERAESFAFEPPRASEPPAVAAAGFVRDPIDAFVAAKLESEGLAPSAPADARTAIRRATLDVTGLPPTPEEVAAYVAEARADPDGAYARLVDRLLASPRYGERCAADWLDVVRFAETQGFEMNQPRGEAWPYRDWVIGAFNDDRPWTDFVRAQLAGDQLDEDAATGFLVAGTWDEVKSPDPELTAIQRDDELHGMVSTTGAAFLGLTVGCAKCHDHKFDPIDQKDYYALRACFEGVQFGARPWHRRGTAGGGLLGREPVDPRGNVDRFAPVVARRVRFVVNATNGGEPCLDELEVWSVGGPATDAGTTRRNVALASAGAVARASSVYAGNPRHTLEHVNDGRYGNDFSWIAREIVSWIEIELPLPTAIDTVLWSRDRRGAFSDRLATDYRIEALVEDLGWRIVASSDDRRPIGDEPQVYAGRFDASPPATHRLERGNPMEPREPVAPGALARVPVPFRLADPESEPARRLALADWIASPDNPLTARVIVNRVWQQHFGKGLVETPSDFGAMGGKPSHPELLDRLALDLIAGGWRLKALHRRILLSATYRQASAARSDGLARDADDRLLWRFPPRRLPAEAIRDSMLAAAGVLDLTMGGPSVSTFVPNENYVRVYEPKSDFGPADFRRSIYLMRVRMHPDATFGAFDMPDGGQPCPRRAISTTPLQALALTHAPFVAEVARRFAGRVERETRASAANEASHEISAADASARLDAEITRAFELAYQREPAPDELSAASAVAREHGLTCVCRALLAAGEIGEIE